MDQIIEEVEWVQIAADYDGLEALEVEEEKKGGEAEAHGVVW
jgi:hypothetical protein